MFHFCFSAVTILSVFGELVHFEMRRATHVDLSTRNGTTAACWTSINFIEKKIRCIGRFLSTHLYRNRIIQYLFPAPSFKADQLTTVKLKLRFDSYFFICLSRRFGRQVSLLICNLMSIRIQAFPLWPNLFFFHPLHLSRRQRVARRFALSQMVRPLICLPYTLPLKLQPLARGTTFRWIKCLGPSFGIQMPAIRAC